MANSDSSRKFLVTTFRCAACGEPLSLTHSGPKGSYVNDGITGANQLAESIYLHPCTACAKPAKEIQAAIKTLLGVVNNG